MVISDIASAMNVFIERLQEIMKLIVGNTKRMEAVVSEVRGSVQTSDDNVSDLSAMTEELAATISEIKDASTKLFDVSEELTGELNMYVIY